MATVNKRARISRVVEYVQCAAVHEGAPLQLAFVWPPSQSLWEQELFLAKGFDDSTGRAGAAERVEEESQTLLHLFVRIQDWPPLGAVCEAHRQRAL
jgi:hypothetical protein